MRQAAIAGEMSQSQGTCAKGNTGPHIGPVGTPMHMGRSGFGDAEDFFGRGQAAADLVPPVLAEESEAVLAGGPLDPPGGSPLYDQLADFLAHHEQFIDSHTTLVSDVAALTAAATAIKRLAGLQFQVRRQGGVVGFVGFLAVFAGGSHEPLSQDAFQRTGDQERFDAHHQRRIAQGIGKPVRLRGIGFQILSMSLRAARHQTQPQAS